MQVFDEPITASVLVQALNEMRNLKLKLRYLSLKSSTETCLFLSANQKQHLWPIKNNISRHLSQVVCLMARVKYSLYYRLIWDLQGDFTSSKMMMMKGLRYQTQIVCIYVFNYYCSFIKFPLSYSLQLGMINIVQITVWPYLISQPKMVSLTIYYIRNVVFSVYSYIFEQAQQFEFYFPVRLQIGSI